MAEAVHRETAAGRVGLEAPEAVVPVVDPLVVVPEEVAVPVVAVPEGAVVPAVAPVVAVPEGAVVPVEIDKASSRFNTKIETLNSDPGTSGGLRNMSV